MAICVAATASFGGGGVRAAAKSDMMTARCFDVLVVAAYCCYCNYDKRLFL